MVRFPKILLGLLVVVGLAVAGCNGSEPPTQVSEPTPVGTSADTAADGDAAGGETAAGDEPLVQAQSHGADSAEDGETVAVSIYVMDDSCSDFQAESVQVPAEQAMTEAIGEVLERHRFEAFKLSGYRVNVEASKAVVDLRLAEDSERQFLSLSSCEQQGLFGGLEETLIQHPTWQVNQVEFTNRGQEIVL